MTNVCSVEHPFWRKAEGRHRPITVLALSVTLALLLSGCLPEPQRNQATDLLDRLTLVRTKLGAFPPPPEACNDVGDVETRLYGEPGLTELRPTWSELADAAHALQAVCGQDALLLQPTTGSLSVETARERWRTGQQHELSVACDHLRAAATTLSRDAPC